MQCRFFSLNGWHQANLKAHSVGEMITFTHNQVEIILRMELFSNGADSFIKVLRFHTIDTSDYLDFLGIETVNNQFFQKLLAKIHYCHPDLLLFSNIVFESRFHRLLKENLSRYFDTSEFDGISSFGIKPGSGFEDYLCGIGKQSSRNLIRIRKKIGTLKPVFSVKEMDEDDLNWLMKHQAIRAQRMSYDRLADGKVNQVIKNMIPDGHLKFAELRVNSRLISGMVILDDDECFGIYLQAFDGEYARYYPSLFLLTELIDYSSSLGYAYLDLLRGDEAYKLHFCNHNVALVKFAAIVNKSLDLASVEGFIKNLIE